MSNANTLNQENQIPIDLAEGAIPQFEAGAIGTVIRVTATDTSMAAVVEAGYERLVVERSKDTGLSWQEITVPSERPVLEAAKTAIIFYDRRGDPEYLYRFRYIGTIVGERRLTKPSVGVLGAGLAISKILTVDQLKARYLFGVDITGPDGKPMPEAVFTHYILTAIRWFEHQLDIPILPTAFVERHDYYREDYAAYSVIQLDNYPVLHVDKFDVKYPSGQSVVEFPNEWLRLDNAGGTLQVVPTAGTLSEVLVGQGGAYLPGMYNGLQYLPQLYEVTYQAGFAEGKVPANIRDLIGMFASLGPFHIFGDLIAGAGIATISLSMDGLSQNIGTTSSATNAGYGARVGNYLKQIKEQIPILRRHYKGMRMIVA